MENPNYFGMQAEDAPTMVESSLSAYDQAFGGRKTITESVFIEVNDKVCV